MALGAVNVGPKYILDCVLYLDHIAGSFDLCQGRFIVTEPRDSALNARILGSLGL